MLTYKFKIYSNKKNNRILEGKIDIAGCIYNHCIALHKRYYRLTGKHLHANQLKKHLTKLKKQKRFAFWNMLGSQAIQDIAERIDRAYKLFFRNLKHGIKTAPPSFKKVKKYTSFTLKQAGWKLTESNDLRIMGIRANFHKSRNILGKIKTVTIKRSKVGDLYVYFVTDLDVEPQSKITTGKSAGFDFGLKTFLTVSDGTTIESPLFLKKALNRKRALNKRFSRKVKGSSNWYALKRQIAKLDEKISNQRRDWFFKLAHELCVKYDEMYFEDLNLKGMTRLWGRKVNDLAFGTFIEILKWVAHKTGKLVAFVNRFFPSSKMCNGCKVINTKLELSDRHWRCGFCGQENDRDDNAANNIHCEGKSSHAEGTVRRELAHARAA